MPRASASGGQRGCPTTGSRSCFTEPRCFAKGLLKLFEILLAAHGEVVRWLLGGTACRYACQNVSARCTYADEVFSDGGFEPRDCAAGPLRCRQFDGTDRAAQQPVVCDYLMCSHTLGGCARG